MTTEISLKRNAVSDVDRARAFSALGDPIRLGVVDRLAAGDLSPDQLATDLQITGNLLAHHLKVLADAELVTRTQSQNDGRRTYVHLRTEALDGLLPEPAPIAAPRVVFVCTHNSARSVLADAAWRQASDVPSISAGTHPADAFNAQAVAVARRAGLTITRKTPQALDDVLRPDDVVVSVCDAVNEHLPALNQPHLHWSIPDPSRVGTDAAFTAALADISHRVSELTPRVTYRRATRRTQ